MLLAYLTTDETNTEVCRRLAARQGMTVTLTAPRGGLPECGSAVLLDLDYLPAELAARWLVVARTWGPSRVLAVHGYNLPAAESRRLRKAGVVVVRRLTSRLLAAIRTAVRGRQARTTKSVPVQG